MPKKNLRQRLRGKWSAAATERQLRHAWHDRYIAKSARQYCGGHIPRQAIEPMTLSLSELVDWSRVIIEPDLEACHMKLLDFEPEIISELTGKMIAADYKLGAKASAAYFKEGTGVQIKDIDDIDCSGFFRLTLYKACGVLCPDGSAAQLAWLRNEGFKESTVEAGKLKDGILRAAVRPQQPGSTGGARGRHIVWILNARTYESSPSTHGPGSRPWTGTGWQAQCKVFVVAQPK